MGVMVLDGHSPGPGQFPGTFFRVSAGEITRMKIAGDYPGLKLFLLLPAGDRRFKSAPCLQVFTPPAIIPEPDTSSPGEGETPFQRSAHGQDGLGKFIRDLYFTDLPGTIAI